MWETPSIVLKPMLSRSLQVVRVNPVTGLLGGESRRCRLEISRGARSEGHFERSLLGLLKPSSCHSFPNVGAECDWSACRKTVMS